MRAVKKRQVIKMNLTLTREFYQLLQDNARADYMKVATWTKRFLMKSLIEGHKAEGNCLTQDETE